GYFSEVNAADALAEKASTVAEETIDTQTWVFGKYQGIDPDLTADLSEENQKTVTEAKDQGKQAALMNVALFPVLMLIAYVGLIVYFRSKGGYAAVELTEGGVGSAGRKEEELAGAVAGPVR
ncbi:MAG: hypothetical protein AAF907_15145, partial [Planctomycetota bacterium]